MFKAVSKTFIFMVILFAFVGQTVAFNVSLPCEPSVGSVSSNASNLAKHYNLNPEHTNDQEDCCGIDCCGDECACIANACASIVYFNTDVNSTQTGALSDIAYMQNPKQTKSIAAIVYRPPIFTS